MTVKAINKSNYTLHYIVFNKKYIKKVILKLEVVQYYKKTFFFFFFKLASYKNKLANEGISMLSWNPGKHRTAAKHPIPLKVAVWNFWKKAKQTSAFWTVNPIKNKAKEKMLVG